MKRSAARLSAFTVPAGIVLFAMMLIGLTPSAPSAPTAGAAAIIGSWKLISYVDRAADGREVHVYGRAPAGLIIYDATGHMAVQMMKTPPPDVASDDWDRFTIQEKAALWDGYVAYFGRYEVDSIRKVVTHLPTADLSRLYIGKREERHYQLEGDRLTLSETWVQSGKRWSGVRVFERLH